MRASGRARGRPANPILRASTEQEIDAAYATAKEVRAGAIFVAPMHILQQQARPDLARRTRCASDVYGSANSSRPAG